MKKPNPAGKPSPQESAPSSALDASTPASSSGRFTGWLRDNAGLTLAGVGLLLLVIGGAFLLLGDQDSRTTDGAATRPSVAVEGIDDQPTRTAKPTTSPEPVAVATSPLPLTTAPLSELAITAENLQRVEELARLGRGTINALAVNPGGVTLAVAGSLGVWLYDAVTFEPFGLLESRTGPVSDVAWSWDGTRLASADKGGIVRVWQVSWSEEGPLAEEELALRGHVGAVGCVTWSPDGTRLASGGWDDTVRIWSIPGGTAQQVLSSHAGAVLDLAWSPDGSHLASASRDTTVRMWSAPQGEGSAREMGVFGGHTKPARTVAWSPDGKKLASGGEDETVWVWPVPAGEESAPERGEILREAIPLAGHTSYVQSIAWSPDGTWLASVGLDRAVRLWDAESGEERLVIRGHAQAVRDLVWSPDGTWLATGAEDGSIRAWNPMNGAELRVLSGHSNTVLSLAWSPDGTQLAAGNEDGTIQVWSVAVSSESSEGLGLDIGEPQMLKGHRGKVHSLAWSPDGTQLASAGGILDDRVLLWETGEFGRARLLDGHTSAVLSAAWSPDSSQLASASWDNTVRVWDAQGRPLRTLKEHTDWVLSVAWAPNGAQLASGGKDGTVRIWDADSEEQLRVLKGHTDQVTSVAWSPDGVQLATTSLDGTLRLWEASSGRLRRAFQTPGAMTSASWSPSGTLLAMASEFRDNLVRVWNATSGGELHTLVGHADYVKAVAWSPNGALLATGGADGTVRVWGVAKW